MVDCGSDAARWHTSVARIGIGEDGWSSRTATGLYIFSGGEPVKISQEIQPTWNKINCSMGHTLWVTVDTKERRILIGAPMGRQLHRTKFLCWIPRPRFRRDIAGRPPVTIGYTGEKPPPTDAQVVAVTIAANMPRWLERIDGTAQVAVGNGAGTGKNLQAERHAIVDDGAAIPVTTRRTIFRSVPSSRRSLSARIANYSATDALRRSRGNLGLTSFVDTPNSRKRNNLPMISPAPRDSKLQ